MFFYQNVRASVSLLPYGRTSPDGLATFHWIPTLALRGAISFIASRCAKIWMAPALQPLSTTSVALLMPLFCRSAKSAIVMYLARTMPFEAAESDSYKGHLPIRVLRSHWGLKESPCRPCRTIGMPLTVKPQQQQKLGQT